MSVFLPTSVFGLPTFASSIKLAIWFYFCKSLEMRLNPGLCFLYLLKKFQPQEKKITFTAVLQKNENCQYGKRYNYSASFCEPQSGRFHTAALMDESRSWLSSYQYTQNTPTHLGGNYEKNGKNRIAASEGCFGICTPGHSSFNQSKNYSNNILNTNQDRANKSQTNPRSYKSNK